MVRNAHKILVMLSSPIAIKGALCSGPPLQHILVGKLARRNKQARGQIPSSPAPWLLSARQLKKKNQDWNSSFRFCTILHLEVFAMNDLVERPWPIRPSFHLRMIVPTDLGAMTPTTGTYECIHVRNLNK